MVNVNFIRVNPTSEYLDINVFTPVDFNITGLFIKADGYDYVNYSKLLTKSIDDGYMKEQILRIPLKDINKGKHLIFVKFKTLFADPDTHKCKPSCYKDDTITEVAVADTKFVYDAKVKLIKRDVSNPTCFTAYLNDIVKIDFIETMFNQSIFYEQWDRASYWMSQLESEVQFINNNN